MWTYNLHIHHAQLLPKIKDKQKKTFFTTILVYFIISHKCLQSQWWQNTKSASIYDSMAFMILEYTSSN